jgi:hypothetical protein
MHLRVIQDQPTEEVCDALAISEDNLFVRCTGRASSCCRERGLMPAPLRR